MSKKKAVLFIVLALVVGIAVGVGAALGVSHAMNTGTTVSATSGSCGSGLSWTYDEGTLTLTISGRGRMWDFGNSQDRSHDPIPSWYGIKYQIEHVVIEYGVMNIGNQAFQFFNMMKDISIPDSVTSIGEDAFGMCTKLEEIQFPETLQSIGAHAFDVNRLKKIEIPCTVTYIGSNAFMQSMNLESLVLPDSVLKKSADSQNVFQYTDTSQVKVLFCGTPEEYSQLSNFGISQDAQVTYHSFENGICTCCGINDDDSYLAVRAGMHVQTFDQTQRISLNYVTSVVVKDVVAGGPADQAGIQAGDCILSIGDLLCDNYADYDSGLQEQYADADSLTFRMERNVWPYDAEVTLNPISGGGEDTGDAAAEEADTGETAEEAPEAAEDIAETAAAESSIETCQAELTMTEDGEVPEVTVTDGDVTLTQDVDYALRFEDDEDGETGWAVITGCGSYYGELRVQYQLTANE